MKVTIATHGKFHLFDLARQLHERDMLSSIFTGYPRYKVRHEDLPSRKIKCFSAFHVMALIGQRKFGRLSRIGKDLTWVDKQMFDAHVAHRLEATDVFIGHSSVGLGGGVVAKRLGALYVCDRGSSHIRYQDDILKSEYSRHGLVFEGVDERVMVKEEKEYELADLIFLPSKFVRDTFLSMGVPAEKLRIIPYGVDLQRFSPVAHPRDDAFDVLFVGYASIRKGIPYLIEAFGRLKHPRKQLTIIGNISSEIEPMLKEAASRLPIRMAGHIPQAELSDYMSRSHVLVLPSIEDGFGMVQAQSMACGCPVIGTSHTGSGDLYSDGMEGFIVRPGSADDVAQRLQQLADDPDLRARMGDRARLTVRKLGGWKSYSDSVVDCLNDNCARRSGS